MNIYVIAVVFLRLITAVNCWKLKTQIGLPLNTQNVPCLQIRLILTELTEYIREDFLDQS